LEIALKHVAFGSNASKQIDAHSMDDGALHDSPSARNIGQLALAKEKKALHFSTANSSGKAAGGTGKYGKRGTCITSTMTVRSPMPFPNRSTRRTTGGVAISQYE
jgi:hypothetical protein